MDVIFLNREDRLVRLYRVLGLHDEEIFDNQNQIIDPDDTYELTTDNVKKILAIYMRFRSEALFICFAVIVFVVVGMPTL
jgi:hypothetical protein